MEVKMSNGAKAIWFHSKVHFRLTIDCTFLKGSWTLKKGSKSAFHSSFNALPTHWPIHLLTIDFNVASTAKYFLFLLPLNCFYIKKSLWVLRFSKTCIGEMKYFVDIACRFYDGVAWLLVAMLYRRWMGWLNICVHS